MEKIQLSIIIPAYNEERRIILTLAKIQKFLSQQNYLYEILVIDNASADTTFNLAVDYSSKWNCLRVIREPKRGKGNAIRKGMLEAKGKYLFMCDADLSMPIEELPKFLPPLNHCDIAIGSREAIGAVRYNEPFLRNLFGRVFNLLVRLLILPGIKDTQCGFKCFTRKVAQEAFRLQTIEGWSFDVEILYIANRMGYKINEIPISWYYAEDSKVSPITDTYHMFLDILKIKRNVKLGLYEKLS